MEGIGMKIPVGLRHIEECAYKNGKHLRSVTIPVDVTTIGREAFRGCHLEKVVSFNPMPPVCGYSAFETMDMDNAVLCVPIGAGERYSVAREWRSFQHILETADPEGSIETFVATHVTTNVTKKEMHHAMMGVDGVAYGQDGRRLLKCTDKNIVKCELKEGVQTVCKRAFADCRRLARVKMPDSVRVIGEKAFIACHNLMNMTIPEGVISIGKDAFLRSGLRRVRVPKSVTFVGDFAFAECERLTRANIGSGVTLLGYGAFDRCPNLTDVILSSGVTIVEDRAFRQCMNLKTIIVLNPTPPECGEEAFLDVPVRTCTLYVTKGARKSYSMADGWKEFRKVEEIG